MQIRGVPENASLLVLNRLLFLRQLTLQAEKSIFFAIFAEQLIPVRNDKSPRHKPLTLWLMQSLSRGSLHVNVLHQLTPQVLHAADRER